MKKNQGFTLVEMIIVIAIAGILAGSSVMALNSLKYANAKKCANEIDSMIDKARVLSMTKGPTYLYIYVYKGEYHMKCQQGDLDRTTPGTFLCNDDITITAYSNETPATSKKVSILNSIKIAFKRSNGALLPDNLKNFETLDDTPRVFNKIVVSSENTEYTIRIVELTGKHYIE